MHALMFLTAMALQTPDTVTFKAPLRDIAYSSGGHLAFAANGDIWVLPRGNGGGLQADPVHVTSGRAWDHQPAWTPDGSALIFSSDRAGQFDLWQVAVGDRIEAGEPTRLTSDTSPASEPSVAPDGSIVFVLGRDATSNLWRRFSDGRLEQITARAGGEFQPAVSPDGAFVAYVSVHRGRSELRKRALTDDTDERVIAGAVESPAWSPDGRLIAYGTRGANGGVRVTPPDGRYSNLVSPRPAEPAWTPDGSSIALAPLRSQQPGYNGDPQRIDRGAEDLASDGPGLWLVPAPRPAHDAAIEMSVRLSGDRRSFNENAFDQVADRLAALYFRGPRRAEWEGFADPLRTRAIAARTIEQVDDIIHELISNRPTVLPEVSGRAAVSSAHPLATEAGTRMLELGGNVVDAAIAVSFALGVVEPDASGIGGYGEMVVHLTGMEQPTVIEFLTRVPEHAGLTNAALLSGGTLPPDGPVLVNVPGTVAGMYRAFEHYGSGDLTWAQLVEPAIELADSGFVLDDAFTTTLNLERDRYSQYESSRALFFRDGRPLAAGDEFRNPDLAWTLRQIAERGADGFYEGEVARRMVEDLRGKGNAITMLDMARYFAPERPPVVGTYRGHTIYGAAPAVSGGASLVAKLNLLGNATGLGLYRDDPRTLHAMVEAWKLQPSSQGLLADPSLWPVDLEPLTDRDAAATRWTKCFDPARSSGPEELRTTDDDGPACADIELASSWGEDIFACEDSEHGCRHTGTTAFAVADAGGNLVSVTQTLGTWGGNFYVTPGLGFIYNDKLGSYGTNPDDYNARLPYARNSTSIAPTLVFKGTGDAQEPYLAVGAAGNAWITAAVYQTVSGVIDGGLGPQRALELPRFLVGVRRDPRDRKLVSEVVIQLENGLSPRVRSALEAMGHTFQDISWRGELRMGYGAAVLVENGAVRAGADPRRSGAARAIQ